MDTFDPQPLATRINLNGKESRYLNEDENCYFYHEDVSWYEYSSKYRAFDSLAQGTIYVTDRQIILYDPGFSNIWTKLSKDGDYPEQVITRNFDEIDTPMFNTAIGNGRLKGPAIKCIGQDCWLPPSQRNYKNRRTPFVSEYPEMNTMVEIIMKLKIRNKHNL